MAQPDEPEQSKQPDIVGRTFRFGQRVNELCRYLESDLKVEQDLARQLLRSARSVGAMMEEAQGAESRKDFIHKVSVGYKEARESHFWLRQLVAAEVIPLKRLESLVDEARQLKFILSAIIKSAKRGDVGRDSQDKQELDATD